MKEVILNINNEILDGLDMTLSNYINSDEYRKYFNDFSSKEHYRLLTYLSKVFNDCNILDVGTFYGASALALSFNESNKVYSFNLHNELKLNKIPQNIEFITDNIISGKYDSMILSSKLILLDTFHDGVFEQLFLDYLINLKYNGILILDDIYLNKYMEIFWEKISLDKIDITHLGHSTGTGVVFISS